uniref:Dirigent protein n=1 Tax=Tamarix androssowii TaxID=189785 RepID=Q1KPV7_9CARY|nr:dirigent-related protein [Tamarix androssowii]
MIAQFRRSPSFRYYPTPDSSLIAKLPWPEHRLKPGDHVSDEASGSICHDIVSGKDATAVKVAQASGTDKSPTAFGSVTMADDKLTEGPEPSSKIIGRAQGLYASACQEELGLLMAMSYSFTDGIYNGSSLSILGRNTVMHPVRELPVVGGTGVFRMARGFALAKTNWFSMSGDAIVGYNVTVIH